jgi:hypothetical protein
MKYSIQTAAILFFLVIPAAAQECKIKIAVAHWDGKALEIGLTPDQSKYWTREKGKRYPTFCLDGTMPDYVIVWTERTSSDEIRKLTVRRGAGGSDPEKVITLAAGPSADSAHYFIFDLSKEPAVVVHTGAGAKESVSTAERPLGERLGPMPDKSLDISRLPNSVPDPAEAMKNAFDWLRKKH